MPPAKPPSRFKLQSAEADTRSSPRTPLLLAALVLVFASRPPAASWPAAVAKLRAEEVMPTAYAALAEELGELSLAALGAKVMVGERDLDAEDLWAADALLFSVGCSRKACFVGVLGSWWRLPQLVKEILNEEVTKPRGAQYEHHRVWVFSPHGQLCALGALAVLSYSLEYLNHELFDRLCTPSLRRPHTLLLGGFATKSPYEAIWIAVCVHNTGAEVQKILGTWGFLWLYVVGCVATAVAAAVYPQRGYRCHGAGGMMAMLIVYAARYPTANYTLVYGVTVPVWRAVAANTIFVNFEELPDDLSNMYRVFRLPFLEILKFEVHHGLVMCSSMLVGAAQADLRGFGLEFTKGWFTQGPACEYFGAMCDEVPLAVD